MSLHAQLTPDATRVLRLQKRNSTLLSLLISIFTVILTGVLLAFFFIQGLSFKDKPSIISRQALPSEKPPTERPPQTAIKRTPSQPSRSMTRVLLAESISPISLPTPEIVTETPSNDYGISSEIGEGWSNDNNGNSYSPIPADSRKRCSKSDRLKRLAESGGNEACEDSVLKALRWLQKNQNPNGSWGREKPVAMTGLALLAYLGRCETPTSLEFGSTVTDGLMYLLDNSLKQNGKCASDLADKHWCYEHAIAVYALSESYLFCRTLAIAPQLKEAVESGTQWILDNQTEAGGWDYAYSTSGRPGDSSIVAWHLQALKAAKATGIRFPKLKGTIGDGLEFLDNCQNENGGFGYGFNKQPVGSAEGHFTLTGAGTLCFQQHKGISNSNARKGIRYLSVHASFDFATKNANLYEHYYCSQALINHGGQEWQDYNNLFRDELLQNQKPDGSWPNPGGPGSHSDPVYATALATLMLEVYYRYLPSSSM